MTLAARWSIAHGMQPRQRRIGSRSANERDWFRMQTSIPSMWSGAIQKRLNPATLVTPAFRCATPPLFRRPKGDMDDDQTYDRDRRRNRAPKGRNETSVWRRRHENH